MGRRSGTETAFAILRAFVQRRRRRQAELAGDLGLTVAGLRKHLLTMRELMPLDDRREHPDVFWEVPRSWHPAGLLLDGADVARLVRVLSRAPRTKERDRLIERVVRSEPRAAPSPNVRADALAPEEEAVLDVVEDSLRMQLPLRMRYFSATRGDDGWRHVSVARVKPGPPARFIAYCHRANELRWFRVGNIGAGTLDRELRYRAVAGDLVDAFERESVNSYRANAAAMNAETPSCVAFVVRAPEARWCARNLPTGATCETLRDGSIRVTASALGLVPLARFVVGLGDAATCESEDLKRMVRQIARCVLGRRRRGRAIGWANVQREVSSVKVSRCVARNCYVRQQVSQGTEMLFGGAMIGCTSR